jgi:hypothetical protein
MIPIKRKTGRMMKVIIPRYGVDASGESASRIVRNKISPKLNNASPAPKIVIGL